MSDQRRGTARLVWSVVAATMLLALTPGQAAADTSGTLTITSDTTLTENHDAGFVGVGIRIAADDVTLDCAGHTVTGGDAGFGILVENHSGVTVKNCYVTRFSNGIVLQNAPGNTLMDDSTFANSNAGVALAGADGNRLISNDSYANGDNGFQLSFSSGNSLEENIAKGNQGTGGFAFGESNLNELKFNSSSGNVHTGFHLSVSSSNSFEGNRSVGNGDGFAFHLSSDQNTSTGDLAKANGDTGFLVSGSSGNHFIEDKARDNVTAGFRLQSGATGNVMIDSHAQGGVFGWLLFDAPRNTFRANLAKRNVDGFTLFDGANENLFERNRALNNQDYGYSLLPHSVGNVFRENVACGNGILDATDDNHPGLNTWEDNTFCSDMQPVPAPPGSCATPPADLAGWWPGDGSGSDIIGDHDASLVGDATFAAGKVAQSFALDGDGDFIDVPDSSALNVGTGDFTVDLWVRFASTGGEQILIEDYVETFDNATVTGWTLTKLENNTLLLALGSAGGVATEPLDIPLVMWIHVAARRQGDTVSLFVNGTEMAATELADPALSLDSVSSLKFGHRGSPEDTPGSLDDSGFFLQGRIDEVELVVGRALSDQEIAGIVAAGAAGKCKG